MTVRLRARDAALLACATLAACTWGAAPAPLALVAVDPPEAPNHLDTVLRVEALHLAGDVVVDFDDPDASRLSGAFDLALVAGEARIPLGGVRPIAPTLLEGTLPMGTAAGLYDLELRDGQGHTALLSSALGVFVPECTTDGGPCDDEDLCTSGDTCIGWRCQAATAVSCVASDACHEAGICDPETGACSDPATPDGTACYLSCTVGDTCQAGVCTPPPGGCEEPQPVDAVAVTTALDERDAGATPAAPGGTGLSLREAITWVNLQPAPWAITIPAPMTILMTGAQRDVTLTAAGAAVVAAPGVTLDFDGFNQACIKLDGPAQRLVGATITGCSSVFVQLTSRSAGSQVAHVAVAQTARTAIGVQGMAASLPASLVGPGNDLSGLATAVDAQGTGYEIFENRLHGNTIAAKLYGLPARVHRNALFGQQGTGPNQGVGLRVYRGTGPVEVLHNVFDRNAVYGLQADDVSGLTIRNNLFTHNGTYGLSATATGIVHDHDGFHGNGTAPVAPNLTTGPTDLLTDPHYVDGSGGDFRLQSGSPAIDAGTDTGLDVNGAAAGLYNGAAPDLGATETP